MMYVKAIELQNTGPVQHLNVDLPFDGVRPKPVILVGPNGSGKSTVLSFIVNALVALKQPVFEDSEVEKGRVYRMRSPLFIRSGSHYYHANLRFENGAQSFEWQLDRPRDQFDRELGPRPEQRWNKMLGHEVSYFDLAPGSLDAPHKIEKEWKENCVLFFAADRFEPPDWLNIGALSSELKLPEVSRMKGQSLRRIFARNRLKPTLEWLASVQFDMLLKGGAESQTLVQGRLNIAPAKASVRIEKATHSDDVFAAAANILREILTEKPGDQIRLTLGNRNNRILSIQIIRDSQVIRAVSDVLSLSAGESALFCLFASIIRDADLAGMNFATASDIRGLVLVDEVDLHLHLGLQFNVLPKLLAMFPAVQFILTAHSPLVVLGMKAAFGNDGFTVLEMPAGREITSEAYSEFQNAFEVFANTKKFEDRVLQKVNAQPKPVLLVEGITDASIIATAWEKLNPAQVAPFEIVPCGIEPSADARAGGAKMLRNCLEFLAVVSNQTMLAVFDNDRIGNEQFAGVNKKAFDAGRDYFHKKHKTKSAHAILLPVLTGREIFVTPGDLGQWYLSIEHYFSDAILAGRGMKGEGILGTAVFEISGNKKAFADHVMQLDASVFDCFRILFERVVSIISETHLGEPIPPAAIIPAV